MKYNRDESRRRMRSGSELSARLRSRTLWMVAEFTETENYRCGITTKYVRWCTTKTSEEEKKLKSHYRTKWNLRLRSRTMKREESSLAASKCMFAVRLSGLQEIVGDKSVDLSHSPWREPNGGVSFNLRQKACCLSSYKAQLSVECVQSQIIMWISLLHKLDYITRRYDCGEWTCAFLIAA